MRAWHDPQWRIEFARGVRALLPAYPGIVAWGVVTGVAMVKSGLSVPWALVMTMAAYAGSAQLAALPLIAAAAPLWMIGATALITNLRFVIYGAAMRPWLHEYSRPHRTFIGYLSGDFSFVLFMDRVAREGAFRYRYAWLLGITLSNWVVWQAASVAGIVGASFIPTDWGLQFAGTLALLALVVPLCRARAGAAGALTAGLVALAGHAWPLRSGLLAAVLTGVATATALEGWSTRNREVGT